MIHQEQHELAGQTIKIAENVPQIGGSEYRIEDWWDRVSGQSWMFCDGNPACLCYAARIGMQANVVPIDNEVVYGKIGPFGHLVHVSELTQNSANKEENDEVV